MAKTIVLKQRVINGALGTLGDLCYRQSARPASSWSVVIPVRDQVDMLRRCVMSLQRWAPDAEWIFVDDASIESETMEELSRLADSGSKLVRNETPRGHSESTRSGVEISDRPNLSLLNSDTVITRDSLAMLHNALLDPSVALAGPSTSRCFGQQQTRFAEFRRFQWSDREIEGWARLLRLRWGTAPREVPFVAGFALCLTRQTWDDCGGFDCRLTDFGNEMELASRLQAQGKRHCWIPGAYIHHLGGVSYQQLGQDRVRAMRKHAAEVVEEIESIRAGEVRVPSRLADR